MRGEWELVVVKRSWVPELLFAMFKWVIPYQPFRWVFTRPARLGTPRGADVETSPVRLRAREDEARTMDQDQTNRANAEEARAARARHEERLRSGRWGVKCRKGDKEWWYGGTPPALGTEAEARDKAARRNDSDSDGTMYRAERYTGLVK